MSQQNEVAALLQQGIEAARNGERARARELFERVTELDERSEKGWFWLASVVDSDEERKICLNNVLRLSPANERARTALTALESRQKEAVASEEVVPGISRRTFTLLVGGVVAVIVLLLIVVLIISSNNARVAADGQATQTQLAFVLTDAADQQTAIAAAATQTEAARPTDTPAATNTPNIATLPPTWTPQPSPSPVATAGPLPPVTGLNGLLAVYGGRDVLSNDYVQMGYYNFDVNGAYTQIPVDFVRDPNFFPTGQQVVYTRYDDLLFDSVIEAAGLNGSNVEALNERWRPFGVGVIQPQQPAYSPTGAALAFVARPITGGAGSENTQVFLVTLTSLPPGESPLRQVSSDDAMYSWPRISPDGTRLAAVRQTDAGSDIVMFDLASGSFFPITNDGSVSTETQPRFTLDGSQLVYAAAVATAPNDYDIFVRAADGTGSPSPLVRDPAEDRYPVISPDGQHLAYASNRGGTWDIYVLTIAANETQQLTNDVYDEWPSDWWLGPQ